MENLKSSNIPTGLSRSETMFHIAKEQSNLKFLLGSQDYTKSDVVNNVAGAMAGDAAANKTTVAILKRNEPAINTALQKVGASTQGDIVQKSVRLYNVATRQNFAGGLVALLTDPAIITAIISLVAFLVGKLKKSPTGIENSFDNGTSGLGVAESGNVSGTDWVQFVKDFVSGKTANDYKSVSNTIMYSIIGGFAALVILVLWLANKK